MGLLSTRMGALIDDAAQIDQILATGTEQYPRPFASQLRCRIVTGANFRAFRLELL
ncbi:hypothetical protein AB9U18_19975 [Novosphingobium sp. NRRL B-2648]|uniref:hypothetical protein n=1 Tax=Novosphingobium sp. NRRL B-2648 TaxID=3230802 RepID=UPI003519D53D